MRSIYYALSASLLALPAFAVTVSNLDEKTHFVIFEETIGSKVIRSVDPGETTRAPISGGTAYLREHPDQRIQIRQVDRLAIWPGGKLQIQMRQKDRMGGD